MDDRFQIVRALYWTLFAMHLGVLDYLARHGMDVVASAWLTAWMLIASACFCMEMLLRESNPDRLLAWVELAGTFIRAGVAMDVLSYLATKAGR